MRLANFNEPDETIKTVLLFFQGGFPRKIIPGKDVTLPSRLWPNAKFYIYLSSPTMKNKVYFTEMYNGFEIEFVNYYPTCDISYIQYANYNAWGGFINGTLKAQAAFIEEIKTKVYIFFNDEQITCFQDFAKWVHHKNDKPGGDTYNPGLAAKTKFKLDWSNVVVLFNENKLQDWGEKKIKGGINVNIQYLSDIILYDINTSIIKLKQNYKSKRGCYIAFFIDKRVKLLNKLFENIDIDMDFRGTHSKKLSDHIKGDGSFIKNSELFDILREYDYTIYIGKGVSSMYLGATFYEPLLQGIPIFIWTKTDKEKRIFPNLDVYFETGEELKVLINKWDLEELYKIQIKQTFNFDVIDRHESIERKLIKSKQLF